MIYPNRGSTQQTTSDPADTRALKDRQVPQAARGQGRLPRITRAPRQVGHFIPHCLVQRRLG